MSRWCSIEIGEAYGAHDPERAFEFGLARLLDGIERFVKEKRKEAEAIRLGFGNQRLVVPCFFVNLSSYPTAPPDGKRGLLEIGFFLASISLHPRSGVSEGGIVEKRNEQEFRTRRARCFVCYDKNLKRAGHPEGAPDDARKQEGAGLGMARCRPSSSPGRCPAVEARTG
jgi:hypothetical protein